MEVLPLENIDLHTQTVDIVAKVPGKNPGAFQAGVEALVVLLSADEFRQVVSPGYGPDSSGERAGVSTIKNEHCYLMPVADHIEGEENLSWYGESQLLWSLVGADISCDSVAFIATPAALAYLQKKQAHQ